MLLKIFNEKQDMTNFDSLPYRKTAKIPSSLYIVKILSRMYFIVLGLNRKEVALLCRGLGLNFLFAADPQQDSQHSTRRRKVGKAIEKPTITHQPLAR